MKTIAYLVIFLTFLFFIYTKLNFKNETNHEKKIAPSSLASNSSAPLSSRASSSESMKADYDLNNKTLDAHQARKIEEWHEHRGYYDESAVADYSTYDTPTLERLSKEGDIKAIQLLALTKIKEGKDNEAQELYFNAAALGSTHALDAAASNKIAQYHTTDDNQKEKYILEAFALLSIAHKRRDLIVSKAYIQTMKDINRLNFSAEQEKQIALIAEDLYVKLLSKRIDLGLGDFDNSIPEEVNSIIRFQSN